MSAPDFLDTNVFVYAYDSSEPAKQHVAQDLVRRAVAGEIVTSTQVFAEFAATLLHKLTPPLTASDVIAILDALRPIKTIVPHSGTIRRAVEAHARYGVHFFDGMMIATAELGGCPRIWSEDLSAGQDYFNVIVENPFVTELR